MGRPPIITNEQLLEAAREIFLAEGFGASTVKIARRAGVSEGTLFKRFSTKEKLFFAAMGISEKPAWREELDNLVGKGDLKENLIALAFQIIESFRETVPRMMMVLSKGNPPPSMMTLGHPPICPGMEEPAPVRDLKAMTAFFEGELKLGRLRLCKPESIARIYFGSLMNYIFMDMTGPLPFDIPNIPPSTFVHDLVEILWQGIEPP
jgi:AcrR family transcriptional regulator